MEVSNRMSSFPWETDPKAAPAITRLIGPLDNDKDNGLEGGYSYDAADLGGETKYGITKRSYPDVIIKTLTKAEAGQIYYVDWWRKYRMYSLQPLIGSKLLDVCVNVGGNRGIRLLQQSLAWCGETVAVDGIIGQITITAANSIDDESLTDTLKRCTVDYYHHLVAEHPALIKFLKGWLNRAKS